MREFTEAQANRHNTLAAQGWAFTEGLLVFHDREPAGRPGWYARWRLGRAIRCFERALEINPEGWSSMWALGKIHQRLGDQETALARFNRAFLLKPDQPDVAREAGLAALDLGRVESALTFCEAAVACGPEDPGLLCNLALAYSLAGNDDEALRCVAEAAARDPADPVTATVQRFIAEVATGDRPRPATLEEAFPRA